MNTLIQPINTLLALVPKQYQHDYRRPHLHAIKKFSLNNFLQRKLFESSFLWISYFVFNEVIFHFHPQMCRHWLPGARLAERHQLRPVALTIPLEAWELDQLIRAWRSRPVLRRGLITLSLHRQRGRGGWGEGELSPQLFLLHQSTPVQVPTLHLQRKTPRERGRNINNNNIKNLKKKFFRDKSTSVAVRISPSPNAFTPCATSSHACLFSSLTAVFCSERRTTRTNN